MKADEMKQIVSSWNSLLQSHRPGIGVKVQDFKGELLSRIK
jgi:hypothetical protein